MTQSPLNIEERTCENLNPELKSEPTTTEVGKPKVLDQLQSIQIKMYAEQVHP